MIRREKIVQFCYVFLIWTGLNDIAMSTFSTFSGLEGNLLLNAEFIFKSFTGSFFCPVISGLMRDLYKSIFHSNEKINRFFPQKKKSTFLLKLFGRY